MNIGRIVKRVTIVMTIIEELAANLAILVIASETDMGGLAFLYLLLATIAIALLNLFAYAFGDLVENVELINGKLSSQKLSGTKPAPEELPEL